MHKIACFVVLNLAICQAKLNFIFFFIFFIVIEFVIGHESNEQLENEGEGLG